MIPIKDVNPTHKTPIVTFVFIGINVLAWFLELSQEAQGQLNEFISQWAVIPVQLLNKPGGETVTILTSMFLHGGWGHLLGNMVYLWIFGDNIEDRLGHVRFVIYYLSGGLVATLAQVIIDPGSRVPLIGASGAIAGIMGGYLLLYPKVRIYTLIGYFRTQLPAFIVLGFWFVYQLFFSFGSLSSIESQSGGVAFFAHVGGFLAGLILIKPFLIGRPDPRASYRRDEQFWDPYEEN